MKTVMKRTLWGGAATAAVALVVAGAAFFPTIAQAQTATVSTVALDFQQRGRGAPIGPLGDRVDQNAALAEALGITTEELQAAQTEAHGAAIDQMVTDGWLTETQAEALKAQTAGNTGRMGGMGDLGRGFGPMGDSKVDYDTLLANALGISVDELQAARTQIFDDQLAQAVTDGNMTQAQADLVKAQRALSDYIAPKLQSAYDDAVKAAVSDGIITQEQADALAAQGGHGLRGFGPGMNDGFRGMGDMGGGLMGGRHGGRGGNGWAPGLGATDGQPAQDSTESSN